MIVVAIYVQDVNTLEYNRIDLFSDENISVVSSVQNINDIAKTFTDFSQTFTIPASVQNNKIFKHWYDNSNNDFFSTLVKANAYIEIDTILFRKGKVQLESCNVLNGIAQDYSITFIGTLGNLKDTFAGLFLKDLTDTTYDFPYSQQFVLDKVTSISGSTPACPNIYFPLITSKNVWEYGTGYDINTAAEPIRTNELFPALRVTSILNMIETQFGINFTGSFLTDSRFTPLFMLMKNADEFFLAKQELNFDFVYEFSGYGSGIPYTNETGISANLTTNRINIGNVPNHSITIFGKTYIFEKVVAGVTVIPQTFGIEYSITTYKNGVFFQESPTWVSSNTFNGLSYIFESTSEIGTGDYYEYSLNYSAQMEYQMSFLATATYRASDGTTFLPYYTANVTNNYSVYNITPTYYLPLQYYFPEIKIEDFFSGLLKMFNLTCTSEDGINYNIETLENYYSTGNYVDITQYVFFDKTTLNRVKTYKKINFEYEKSESLINVGFNSANGIEYGSLFYTPVPPADGAEYNIKLPFEDLNFSNLQNRLQVGYCLKTDYQAYIPKPILLYASILDGSYVIDMTADGVNFYVSTTPTGTGTAYQKYRPFGQENFTLTDSFSINFNAQQSTLNNVVCEKGLYNQYYENYIGNIFSTKARLIKVQAILPTSILTSLKLNDRIIIRDARYIINTMTTNLTTGVVQFELLTDFRPL